MDNNNEEIKLSKHSGSVSQIIRLDSLWKDVNNHARLGLYSKWNSDLDRVWCELARDVKEDTYTEKKKDYDKFDEDLAKTKGFLDKGKEGFQEPTEEEKESRNKQYKILMEKELFLRRLENELGKGTKWEDDDDFDFD
jgi:hypothetical protein